MGGVSKRGYLSTRIFPRAGLVPWHDYLRGADFFFYLFAADWQLIWELGEKEEKWP